jgi:hypothetical protein
LRGLPHYFFRILPTWVWRPSLLWQQQGPLNRTSETADLLLPRLIFVIIAAGVAAGVSGCSSLRGRESALPPIPNAPYPRSPSINGVIWDVAPVVTSRKAHGSDLWPCTWARDGNLYCAWGDGGGFDGDDDNIGRVSLGFARIEGRPAADGSLRFTGKNVWGSPPYAEYPATFGGKVTSLISVGGVLYAVGGFWTQENSTDPVQRGGGGPLDTLAWSTDLGKSWHIAPWSVSSPFGSYLNFGRDNAGAFDDYVYLYYVRKGDGRSVYLKRVPKNRLQSDPAVPGIYQYCIGIDSRGRSAWSGSESEAGVIFFDANNVNAPEVVFDAGLHRYLMTVAHGRDSDSSIQQLGLFESRHPWGPWATIAYYEDWAAYWPSSRGEYLGLHVPPNWISADGKTLWCIFSGLKDFDSFNLIKAKLVTER